VTIPKVNNLAHFEEFKAISQRNRIYKSIAKPIALRIQLILSKCISQKQMTFLMGKDIRDAIETTQEVLHLVKQGHKKDFAKKLEVTKAFDRISWLYLRLILVQVGLSLIMIQWIEACFNSVAYAILINGLMSYSIHPSIGLWQSYPLLQILFLVVIEWLMILIK